MRRKQKNCQNTPIPHNTEISEGETPEILEAWAIVLGLISINFCLASDDNDDNFEYIKYVLYNV